MFTAVDNAEDTSTDAAAPTITLTSPTGTFVRGERFIGGTSGATGTPDASSDSAVTLAGGNTITFSDGHANPELQPDSGNIIYRELRKPISRATAQTEDIKVIVEF